MNNTRSLSWNYPYETMHPDQPPEVSGFTPPYKYPNPPLSAAIRSFPPPTLAGQELWRLERRLSICHWTGRFPLRRDIFTSATPTRNNRRCSSPPSLTLRSGVTSRLHQVAGSWPTPRPHPPRLTLASAPRHPLSQSERSKLPFLLCSSVCLRICADRDRR